MLSDRADSYAQAPVISVVLPVYNAALYIREAVESVLVQSFADFELIIINDGSKDATQDILLELKAKDPRIVLVSRENRGIVDSLNEGISLARGVWIARMDADDIALPKRFELQLNWLHETGADICGSWVEFFGSADRRIIKYPQSNSAIKMSLLFGSSFAHPSVVMRTEFAKQLQYHKAWERCEDYDLWERASRAGWIMTNIPMVLLRYRQHSSQISSATAQLQQKLTQEVRSRYWGYICSVNAINPKVSASIVKMRENPPYNFNMDEVDHVFVSLLQSNSGETRIVLLDHMTRLYMRVAADYPDISSRWGRVNSRFGLGRGLKIKLMLLILSRFRIRAGSSFFNGLKRVFLSLTGRGQ